MAGMGGFSQRIEGMAKCVLLVMTSSGDKQDFFSQKILIHSCLVNCFCS